MSPIIAIRGWLVAEGWEYRMCCWLEVNVDNNNN